MIDLRAKWAGKLDRLVPYCMAGPREPEWLAFRHHVVLGLPADPAQLGLAEAAYESHLRFLAKDGFCTPCFLAFHGRIGTPNPHDLLRERLANRP